MDRRVYSKLNLILSILLQGEGVPTLCKAKFCIKGTVARDFRHFLFEKNRFREDIRKTCVLVAVVYADTGSA